MESETKYHRRISDEFFDVKKRRKIYDILGVSEDDDQHLEITDKDKRCIIVHYSASPPNAPPESVKHVRGYVINIDEMKIACATYPYTPEFVPADCPSLLEKVKASVAHEGTILRLYKTGGYIYLSSYRRLTVDFSWSGLRTYRELFLQKWSLDLGIPNQDRCYVFLIQDPRQRIAYPSKELRLFLVGVFEGKTPIDMSQPLEELNGFDTSKIIINKPIKNIETIEQACQYLARYKWNEVPQLLLWDSKGSYVKIQHEAYRVRVEARGDIPNVDIRYLQTTEANRELLVEMFPHLKEYDREVQERLGKLKKLYEKRYVNNRPVKLPHTIHAFLSVVNKMTDTTSEEKIKSAIKIYNGEKLSQMLSSVRVNDE